MKRLRRIKLLGSPLRRGHIIYITLIMIGIFLIGYSSYDLILDQRENTAARTEYDLLRELRPERLFDQLNIPLQRIASSAYAFHSPLTQSGQDADALVRTFTIDRQSYSDFLEPEQPDPIAGLTEINRDFVGWIMIGDFIDYPVVRGRDNNRYLDTTFSGQKNVSGTIFMDSDNKRGFDETVAVLYGHNMRNGTMFAPLHRYRDRTFMEEHPNILILTLNGELLLYRIFAVRVTDVENRDADLGFSDRATSSGVFRGAPAGSNRYLVLSTCTSVDDNERLRVYAALVE